MRIAIVGSGFIGTVLGRRLAQSGHQVTIATRRVNDVERRVEGARYTSAADALSDADVVILALPAAAVSAFAQANAGALVGALVIDTTNHMSASVANSRAMLPRSVRYVRAFNTLGGENFENPHFADGPADMFFSAPEADRRVVEEVINSVGLRPIFVGADQEAIVDGLFRLWIALAITQGRGRRLALRLLEK